MKTQDSTITIDKKTINLDTPIRTIYFHDSVTVDEMNRQAIITHLIDQQHLHVWLVSDMGVGKVFKVINSKSGLTTYVPMTNVKSFTLQ